MDNEKKLPAVAEKNTPKKTRGGKSASLEKNTTATNSDIQEIMGNLLYWYKQEIVKTDEECAERLNAFFARIAETGEIPTVEKMSLALGADRTTVWEWAEGKRGSARANMIKRAKGILATLDAELAATGKMPQVVYIFRSKNFYGMKDQQDITLTPNNPLGDQTSPEELKQKYLDSVVVDVTEE